MAERDPARARYFFMSLQRLIGAILVMVGLLILTGTLSWGDLAGYVFVALGLAEFFIVPVTLARRWRTPKE